MEQNSENQGWTAHAAIAALAVFGPSFIASKVTIANIPTWYVALEKPWFTPPNWVFGPVWTLLYAGLAVALYRILRKDRATPERGRALIIFAVQMALNTFWSIAFFGLHSPALGLVVITLLWLSIIANALAFRRLDRLSAWPFAPYLAWVSFAALLNERIFALN